MIAALQLDPPVPLGGAAALAAVLFAGWLLLRVVVGRPDALARRWGLAVLRAATLLVLAVILAGPVHVDESPGEVQRPDVFYLLDSSQSMTIGRSSTRWDEAVSAVNAAHDGLDGVGAWSSVSLFRFGHRLAAVSGKSTAADRPQDAGADESGLSSMPADTDTRLAEALRQLTSRFGRTPPSGVVLFSDGRVRDIPAVEELARHFGSKKVPIHVYPVGDLASGGDVALLSAVVPQQVRKYSSVDVQIFLRSFGFEGERTQVALLAANPAGGPPVELASESITLRGGVQPVLLSYRSDTRPQSLTISIPPQSDEISTRNNELSSEVDIDRTKIRVLYVEGSDEPVRATLRGNEYEWEGPHVPIQDALTEDEDVECVTLMQLRASGQLTRLQQNLNSATVRGFPETQAELAAFDAIILSNVSSDALTDEQIGWLVNWVDGRGGGLAMFGGPNSFREGRWDETALVDLLPVQFDAANWQPGQNVTLAPDRTVTAHALWNIVTNKSQNGEIVRSAPGFTGLHRGLIPKPLCDVLAAAPVGEGEPAPVIVTGRYGRGRTLAMAVAATSPWANDFLNDWGAAGNRYPAKFWRNLVYWLTESSAIGRRRLVATADKQFYKPGETIGLSAVAFDETARRTTSYDIWAMVEPRTLDFDLESIYSSLRWPSDLTRESGEEGPFIAWGEEFQLPRNSETGEYGLPLELAEQLRSGSGDQGVRIELTAYENTGGSYRGTQVDSTTLDIQVIDDPFEQQNPFPNHDLLSRVASLSGGRVLSSPAELVQMVDELPIDRGDPIVRRTPLWDEWWLITLIIGLLTAEWIWRRAVGLA